MSHSDEFLRGMAAVQGVKGGVKLSERDFPPLNPSSKPSATTRSSSQPSATTGSSPQATSPANSSVHKPSPSKSSPSKHGDSSSDLHGVALSSDLHGVASSSETPSGLHGVAS